MNPTEQAVMRQIWLQVLLGLFGLAVLLGVLSLYLQPDFLVTLANQVWGCF